MAELNVIIDNLHIYIFVFVRLSAIILFNPVFSRQNLISAAKIGLILCLTLLITPLVPVTDFDGTTLDFVLCIGRILSLVFQWQRSWILRPISSPQRWEVL